MRSLLIKSIKETSDEISKNEASLQQLGALVSNLEIEAELQQNKANNVVNSWKKGVKRSDSKINEYSIADFEKKLKLAEEHKDEMHQIKIILDNLRLKKTALKKKLNFTENELSLHYHKIVNSGGKCFTN